MDLKKLTSTLLSSDSVKGLSKKTGASKKEVKNVLAEALPDLLSGVSDQAKGKSTSKGFADALSKHAKDDTKDVLGFFGNVDLEDGAKIVGHLLGTGSKKKTGSIAKKTGVSSDKTSTILSAVAPLLMSLLGKQADEDDEKESGVEAMIGSLLGNVDVGDLLTGLLTDDSSKKTTKKSSKKKTSSSKTKSTSKTKTSKAKSSKTDKAGELIGGILKSFLK